MLKNDYKIALPSDGTEHSGRAIEHAMNIIKNIGTKFMSYSLILNKVSTDVLDNWN